MEVAVRKPSKGTSIALWRHEFYAVFTQKLRGKAAKNDIDIYQALEFRTGSDMPVECRAGLSEKERTAIWVHGVYYATASVIRRANKELRKDRYIFQKDTSDDWSLARSTQRLSGIVLNWLGWTIANAGLQCLTFCIFCRESCTQPTCKGTIST